VYKIRYIIEMPKGGGQIQLLAKGDLDNFLSGNPDITAFKKIYSRYTQFATESTHIYFDGTASFGKKIVCDIPKYGDLLGPLFLEVQLPAVNLSNGQPGKWTNSIGHALIKEVSIEIGQQEIDKQTGEWMEIWSQHTVPAGKRDAFNKMIGRYDGYDISKNLVGQQNLIIPLHFWFCQGPESYLPICAIQHNPIRIVLTIRPLDELFQKTIISEYDDCPPSPIQPADIISLSLWAEYVHLSVDERRHFVSGAHDYIVEQVQYTPLTSISPKASTVNIPMEFNHCIKEFFWYIRPDKVEKKNELMNFSSLASDESGNRINLLQSAVLQLEGQDRFEARSADYFRLVQPYQHHSYVPLDRYIYSYSVATNPEAIQPEGTINVSSINTVNFLFNLVPVANRGFYTTRVYARNYNILRIVEGLGVLLFRA
jgi:hypothetical protein